MTNVLLIIQILLGIGITVAVLLQAQGSGLGSTWGGGGETYHTRRGVERSLMYLTVGGIVLFVFTSLGLLIL